MLLNLCELNLLKSNLIPIDSIYLVFCIALMTAGRDNKKRKKISTRTNMSVRDRKIMPKPPDEVTKDDDYFYRIPPDIIEEVKRRNKNNFGESNTMFDQFRTEVYKEIIRRKKTLEVAEILVSMKNDGKRSNNNERGNKK